MKTAKPDRRVRFRVEAADNNKPRPEAKQAKPRKGTRTRRQDDNGETR